MGLDDKIKNAAEDLGGKVKEGVGKATHNEKLEAEGKADQAKANTVLREGVDCAIVGRPNAGKSTLLNLLAGFDRAIVTPVAGTTRDVVEQAVQLGDIRLNLFDTAGLRQTEDAIEAEGIRRSWRKLDEAGLVLAVFDAAQPLSDDDLELARRCQGRPAIAVLNKQDLAGETDVPRGTLEPYFKKIVPMCARDAVGLQADPRGHGRHHRVRRAETLRRRPDRGQVPQHPRDGDLQEEPRALRPRPGAA